MALLNVNPTRMVLLNLKRRVKAAKRGHKLLKDKQDGLMKTFMEVIREAKTLRSDIEEILSKIFFNLMTTSSVMAPEMLQTALMESKAKVSLEVKTKNVMSVWIPQFKMRQEGSIISYGMWQTSGDLDLALIALQKITPRLIKLAEIEKSAEALALELETTRRRVNALEYKLIPDLRETVKFISMKLGESERSAIVNTMIVKAKIVA
jgi:V/A-type H+-transporting ATPase subunit D